MKRIFLFLVCSLAFGVSGYAQQGLAGEKGVSSIGVIGGYGVGNKSFTLGADYRFNVLDKIRIAPSVFYSVSGDSEANILYANADVHYLVRVTPDVTLYPLAGVGVSIWDWKDEDINTGIEAVDEFIDEVIGDYIEEPNKTRVGLNIGFGVEKRITKDFIIGAEFRYNLTAERAYDQAMFLARGAYYF
ncbi:MAG: porin family protein [Tannerella sp.]|jgi:opacity protein-like surface antigen|nr:porin family protein [Tannerella sp.]